MKRLLIRAILFVALLASITAALELVLAEVNHATHGKFRIGQDVYQVLEAADTPHPQVTTLYLGDSVARQLFTTGEELSPKELYLPSNQAVSVAGQYCILQITAARAPHLRRVYLFYTPRSWANNLDQIFTHDYFCGYFHSPSLLWEIWTLKHDRQLTEAHVGRMLLPNIMANRSQSNYGVPLGSSPPDSYDYVSQTSWYFVGKMKDFCRQRQIAFTILPCPCIGTPSEFVKVAPIYDAPITFYDASLFLPARVHLRKPNIAPIRQRMIEQFHLNAGG
jgi:hypothetical protein